MTGSRPLGPLVHSFFLDHLVTVKGLRPASVRSYRDTIRLLLCFVAQQKGTKITKLTLKDLSFATITSGPATSAWRRCTPCSTTSPRESPRCSAPASR